MYLPTLFASHVLQITVLAGLVWLTTSWLTRKHAHLSYLLWLLVLLKCVTPPIWSSPIGIFSRFQTFVECCRRPGMDADPKTTRAAEPTAFSNDLDDSATETITTVLLPRWPQTSSGRFAPLKRANARTAVDIPHSMSEQWSGWKLRQPSGRVHHIHLTLWLFVVWLVVALVLLFDALCRAAVYVRKLKAAKVEHPMLQQATGRLSRSLGLRRPVQLLVTSCPVGPAVIGLFRPLIVIPTFIIQCKSPAKVEPILAHELIHIRRGDLWVGLFRHFVRSLWWFHPFVWKTSGEVRRGAERCCDEEVIASLGISPNQYARVLLEILELKQQLRSVPVAPGVRPFDITSKRLERIMKLRQGSRQRTPRWCWAAAAALAAIALPGAERLQGEQGKTVAQARDNHGVDSSGETSTVASRPRPINPAPMTIPDRGQNMDVDEPSVLLKCVFLSATTRTIDALQVPWQAMPGRDTSRESHQPLIHSTADSSWGESRIIREKRFPILFALLDDADVAPAIAKGKAAGIEVLSRPQVMTNDGGVGSVLVGQATPFVVGIQDDQPIIEEYLVGLHADLRPALVENGVNLTYRLVSNRIRSVEDIELNTSDQTGIKVQVPEVENTVMVGDTEIAAGKTLLLRMPSGKVVREPKLLLALVKPIAVLPNKTSAAKAKKEADSADEALLQETSDRAVWTSKDSKNKELRKLSLSDCIHIGLTHAANLRPFGIRIASGRQAEPPVNDEPLQVVLERIHEDVSLADAEIDVCNYLVEVTQAYWNLYYQYHHLAACRDGFTRAYATWKKTKSSEGSSSDEAQTRAQYFSLRTRLQQAESDLLDHESRLRYLMGVSPQDRRIEPIDQPTKAKIAFDWEDLKSQAFQHRPELQPLRLRIQQTELQLAAAMRQLLPHHDAIELYRFLGIGAGRTINKSKGHAEEASEGEVEQWRLGLWYQLPIGIRAELAEAKTFHLQRRRALEQLQHAEQVVERELSAALRGLSDCYRVAMTQFNTLQAFRDQVQATQTAYENTQSIPLDVVLDAQSRQTQAEIDFFRAITEYQIAIAELHHRRGTLLPMLGCGFAE